MKRVYVTGQLKGLNKSAEAKNRHNLSLVCRKILLTENIPVCPLLSSEGWELDPRLPSNDEWWVHNYFVEFMRMSDIFSYIPLPAGVYNHRIETEKKIWRIIGDGRFISSDVIMKFLLSGEYE